MSNEIILKDLAARNNALDATKSFIVQAPAGSGKTELLIQRYLTLLQHVKKPEEILAITFTKKAANEMRARVLKALKSAQSDPAPNKEHAKKTWDLAKLALKQDAQYEWHLIQNPNQMRIQTIDSLCAFLTKQLPLLSHFGSLPLLTENPMPLYSEAVREVLSHVEEKYDWSDAISSLLLHLDNDLNKLHDLLICLLQKRDQWMSYIHLDTNDAMIRTELEKQLSLIITNHLKVLKNIFPQELIADLLQVCRYAADHLTKNASSSDIIACRDLTTLPDINAENKKAWRGIAQLLLTKSFSWRKRVDESIGFHPINQFKHPEEKFLRAEHQERLLQIILSINDREDLRSMLEDLFYLPENFYTDQQWHILKSMLTVLKIATAQLRLTFQQHGEIDFIENAQAALSALGDDTQPTDLALALDYQIKHILIDEFQDTSSTQYQLLEKLTVGWDGEDGRTLFVVGDPMQSIYRFREAEVGLFIRMFHASLPHIHLIPLKLSVNFRSTQTIVDWNNLHFCHIFPNFNDMAAGAVTYSQSISSKTTQAFSTSVNIRGFINNETAQTTEIIRTIEQTIRDHPQETIAMLVRSRTHLSELIPALKKANIAYRAVDIDPLASRQIIQDLFSLTCAMLNPADRIAWLAILRAPWCGLTLNDLHTLLSDAPYSTIWEELHNPIKISALSSDGKIRIAKCLPILKSTFADRERFSLRSWIENTWLLLGGPACLNTYDEMQDVATYFSLLQELENEKKIFSRSLLLDKLNHLYATTEDNHSQLHIMTIHSAKGLEFDTVILPHLERKAPIDDKTLLSFLEQPLAENQSALLLAPINATGEKNDPIYTYIWKRQRIKSEHEINRLLYVAATRAKQKLYLFFDVKTNDENKIKIEHGSFLEKLWPLFEKHQHEILISTDEALVTQSASIKRPIKRLNINWQNPVSFKMSHMQFHQKTSGFMLSDELPKLIGIVTHRLFQLFSELGLMWWQCKTANEQHLYLQHQLLQIGVLPSHLAKAEKHIMTMIQNTLQDKRGCWILNAKLESVCEFALTAKIDDQIQNIIIDKTFVDENNVRWIVDYKTTTFSEEDMEKFLDENREKYLEKMQIYAKAMGFIDSRIIRLGLYFPYLSAWKEWEKSI